MTARNDEREVFLSGLNDELNTLEWNDFREKYLGGSTEHNRLVDVIRVVRGECDEETRLRVQNHAQTCEYCNDWFDAYQQGWQKTTLGGLKDQDSLIGVMARQLAEKQKEPVSEKAVAFAQPTPNLPAIPDQSVLTGINTKLRVNFEGAIQELTPYIPGILEAVGISPRLAEEFLAYLRELRPTRIVLSQQVRDFARQTLNFEVFSLHQDRIPRVVEHLEIQQWSISVQPTDPETVRTLKQTAKSENVKTIASLKRLADRLRLANDLMLSGDIQTTQHKIELRQRQMINAWSSTN